MSDNFKHIRSGKVRDIYTHDDYGPDYYIFSTSNRISAFDVVLPDEIPGKGALLNRVSQFWMEFFEDLIQSHLGLSSNHIPKGCDLKPQRAYLIPPKLNGVDRNQLVVVEKLSPLPVEAIVRGYLIGSGWKDYQRAGEVCGLKLPKGLQQASKLPAPIYTPSTKADVGDHDENISYEHTVELLGEDRAKFIRWVSIKMYQEAAQYALSKGIIIADTKFEFGLNEDGFICLMDEVLTPDSSRFWPIDEYVVGTSPPSYDKQIVRDYLETLDWDKTAPGPHLPEEIIQKTAAKYQEVANLLIEE